MGVPQILGLDGGLNRPVTPAELAAALDTGAIKPDVTAGFDNLVINGNFAINQRKVSGTVVLTPGQFGHDRWRAGSNGCTYTFTTSGPDTVLNILAGTLEQVVEAKAVAGGAYVASWSGTAQGGVGINGAGPPAYAASPVAVTGASAGQTIRLVLSTGTVGFATLIPGATPRAASAAVFQRRQYELDLCKRYYQRLVAGGPFGNFAQAAALDSGHAFAVIRFAREMYGAPTLLAGSTSDPGFFLSGAALAPISSSKITADNQSVQGIVLNIEVAGLTANAPYRLNAYNDASAFIAFEAEVS